MPAAPLHVGTTVGVVLVQHPFITYPNRSVRRWLRTSAKPRRARIPAARGGREQQRFRHTPSPAPRCPSRWTGRCWWRTGRTRYGRRPLGQMRPSPADRGPWSRWTTRSRRNILAPRASTTPAPRPTRRALANIDEIGASRSSWSSAGRRNLAVDSAGGTFAAGHRAAASIHFATRAAATGEAQDKPETSCRTRGSRT